MAFGESLGIIDDRINQVKSRSSWPTGQLDQTMFETTDPKVAESIMYIFDVSPLTPFITFIALLHFTRFVPHVGKGEVECADSLDVACDVAFPNYYAFLHPPPTFVQKTRK